MKLLMLLLMLLCVLFAMDASASPEQITLSIGLGKMDDTNISQIIVEQDNYIVDTDQGVTVSLNAYRGKTLKRTVYAWFEDDEGIRISSKGKASLTTRFEHYNLSINLTMSSCLHSGYYTLVVEGIDADTTREVFVDFNCAVGSVDAPDLVAEVKEGKVTFSVVSSPEQVESGRSFTNRVLIRNPSSAYLEVDAWSYVYRSSVSYSGDREQNRRRINLPAFSNVTFDLDNVVDAAPGEYLLKLKFLRSDRKTPKEITLPIRIVKDGDPIPHAEAKAAVSTSAEAPDKTAKSTRRTLSDSDVTGNDESVVYRSSSAKARGLIPYLLIALLVILLVVLILKRL